MLISKQWLTAIAFALVLSTSSFADVVFDIQDAGPYTLGAARTVEVYGSVTSGTATFNSFDLAFDVNNDGEGAFSVGLSLSTPPATAGLVPATLSFLPGFGADFFVSTFQPATNLTTTPTLLFTLNFDLAAGVPSLTPISFVDVIGITNISGGDVNALHPNIQYQNGFIAVPEPSTYLVSMLGLAIAGGYARFRKRRSTAK